MALSYTDGLGNKWDVDSYGNLISAQMAGTWQDALDTPSFGMYIAGSSNAAYISWGAAVVSGNTQSVTGMIASDGISVTRKTYIEGGFVRVLEIVSNTGTSAKTVRLSVGTDIYYDSSTQIVATSNGDKALTAADDWVAYGSSYNASAPRLVHVVAGGAGSPTLATQSSVDKSETLFDLNLAAGQTRTIMHFYALSADTAGATAIGNSLANLAASDYLAGMSSTELNTLDNFTLDVSASVTTTLLAYQRNLTLTGSAAINGTGNAGDNLITGNSANNSLTGLAGNDTLNGGLGADRMAGGQGDDIYIVDNAGDIVIENTNEGVDTVKSSISYSIASAPYIENITLQGSAAISATGNGAGNILDGSLNSAANTLTGKAGNDTYIVGAGDIVVELANEGVDTVVASQSLVLGANLENLVLTGSANLNGSGNSLDNRLTGNSGLNSLSGGAGNDTLDGGAGADRLTGGLGNDTYIVDNRGDVVTEAAGAGTDTVIASIDYRLGSDLENLTLSGTAFQAVGNALANKINGNASDNLIDGGAGADTLAGGRGNDIYIVDNTADVVIEAAGAGIDTVRTGLSNYTLGANVENGEMLGTALGMNGNALNNRIVGNGGANVIAGGGGNDTLMGGGGNDTLDGGDGDDLLIGDQGGPEAQIGSAQALVDGQSVVLNMSAPESATGTVKISGTIGSLNAAQGGINLVYVIDHSGSMDGTFTGNVNIPDMNGDGISNTTMDAAIASLQKLNQSIVASGLGSQIHVSLVQFDDTAETIYSGNPGLDGNGNGVADLADWLQTIRQDGGTAYNMALTEAKNQLALNAGSQNIVFFISDGAPTDGNAYLATAAEIRAMGPGGTVIRAVGTGTGASENPLDLLDDGIDNDSAIIVMNPEELDASLLNTSVLRVAEVGWVELYKNGELVDLIGSDRFTIGPLGVQFESTPIALNASGTDRITAKLMTQSSTGTMLETSLPITIGSFVSNDRLIGGAGNDMLDGGSGSDNMAGGIGDDTFVVDNAGDVVFEYAGEGTDKVISKLGSYTLAANVENLELLGKAVTGIGNQLDNVIVGNAGNNVLLGDAGNDSLSGGLGNDTLNGGAGDDFMVGGAGSDVYYIDSVNDRINEAANDAGTDTVVTVFNTSLGGYVTNISYPAYVYGVENLTLAEGSSATVAVGNDGANVLVGNSNANKLYGLGGNDVLNGGAGADMMDGGAGDDTYYVDNAGDVIVDASGTDTVISSLNGYRLAAGQENLVLSNLSTVLAGTGNTSANKLTGNSYNNVLDGGAGADTMAGGLGNDTYYVDSAFDKVIESANAGVDSVNSSVSYMLTANVENLQLTGTASIGGAGNALANSLIGNAGANRLLGAGGNDILKGGGGNDTLLGDTGNDSLYGGTGNDVLTGGSGQDRFVFDTALNGSSNVDSITDFVAADDTIVLENAVFTRLATTGTLQAGNFRIGSAAADADDYLIYNSQTGELFYDADGSGAGGAVKIAVLVGAPALSYADFAVV